MKLISEVALRRIFPGWDSACNGYERTTWHVVYGPDEEGYYAMPQGGVNINVSKIQPGDIAFAVLEV